MSNALLNSDKLAYLPPTSSPSYRCAITAGRWSGVEDIIRKVAWLHNLHLVMEVDKGWVQNSIRFELRGRGIDIENATSELAYLGRNDQ